MYHGLLKEEARQGKYVLSPAQFESDLKYLKENGYHTVVVPVSYTHLPRSCGARRERESGQGFCRMGVFPRVARAALHFWEEDVYKRQSLMRACSF